MDDKSIRWRRVFLSSSISSVIGLIIIFLIPYIIPDDITERFVDYVCGSIEKLNPGINPFNLAIVCFISFSIYITLFYFIISIIVSIFIIQPYVKYKRITHTILTMIITLIISFSIMFIIGTITS